MKLLEAKRNYLEHLRIMNLSPKTISNREFDFSLLFKITGNIDVKSLDLEKILRVFSFIREKEYALNTYVGICLNIRAFVRWLVDEELVAVKIHRIPMPKKQEVIVQHLTKPELERILNFYFNSAKSSLSKLRDYVLITCLYSTGCRISEILSLDRNEINWNQGSATVIGKGSKVRIIYFNAHAQSILEKYLSHRKDDNRALFVGHSNFHRGRLTRYMVQKSLKRTVQKLGIPKKVTPHIFRHTFATLMLEEGADLITIQRLLGHSDVRSTQIYLHISNSQLYHEYHKYHYLPVLNQLLNSESGQQMPQINYQ